MTVGVINNWADLKITGRVDVDALTVGGSEVTASNGTVTSVAALTLGTTGTDLSSTVATGTTTPVITLQVPTASASNRGALSAADWTTFNSKGSGTVTAVSVATANGVSGSSSGGATPALTLTLGAIAPTSVHATTTMLTSAAPASASATGVVGTITWEAGFLYICTATNTWERVAIATWS